MNFLQRRAEQIVLEFAERATADGTAIGLPDALWRAMVEASDDGAYFAQTGHFYIAPFEYTFLVLPIPNGESPSFLSEHRAKRIRAAHQTGSGKDRNSRIARSKAAQSKRR